jgi:hypothetical protein
MRMCFPRPMRQNLARIERTIREGVVLSRIVSKIGRDIRNAWQAIAMLAST